MPFRSKFQQQWMFANHPAMARRWAEETSDFSKLPEKRKKKPERKTADSYTLSPEQDAAVQRILNPRSPGLIVGHGMGLGKTLTSLDAIRRLNQPADVVVPAALRENYRKEMEKYEMSDYPISIHSLEGVARGTEDLQNPVLVVDEAQRLRGRGKAFRNLMQSPAQKRILLSGTPMVNAPSDILPLMRLVTRKNMYNMKPEAFDMLMDQPDPDPRWKEVMSDILGNTDKKYNPNVWAMNPRELRHYRQQIIGEMKKHIDIQQKTQEDMPEAVQESVKVPMTRRQDEIARALFSRLPASTVRKIKKGLPPDRQDFGAINAFLSASRQMMNGDPRMMQDEESPKLRRAVEDALQMAERDPEAKWLAYSNFLGSGTDIYKKMLTEKGIPYGEFTGDISRQKRQQFVRDYNAGKLRALLLSGAGAEGLDLKGTSMMQLVEPLFDQQCRRTARWHPAGRILGLDRRRSQPRACPRS